MCSKSFFVLCILVVGNPIENLWCYDDCPPYLDVCDWVPWENWFACSATCGNGWQYRQRSLCCEIPWIKAGTCDSHCHKDSSDYYDKRFCAMTCLNGGKIGSVWTGCQCMAGYSGLCCEIDIDECWSSPCLNGGTCSDKINGYTCECPFHYYGVNCETEICQPLPADVIFVLDSSVSQTKFEFERQLEFVNEFIGNVAVGPNDFRFAVITFSTNAKIEFLLNTYSTVSSTQDAVSQIKFKPGVTHTDKGIHLVAEVLRVENGGITTRPNGKLVKQYVILLTDGMSNNRVATKEAAAYIQKRVHKIIAIGVGLAVSQEELLDIASPGDTYTPQYVFSVNDFNSLHTIIEQLVHIRCDKCERSSLSDIILLLDASAYMNNEDFETAIQTMTHLLDKASPFLGDTGLRFGIASFNDELNVILDLDHGLTKESLLAKIQTFSLDGTCVDSNCGMDISEAIAKTFDQTKGGRADARRFLVVLSNGKFKEDVNDDAITEELSDDDVKLLVVGVGDSPNMKALLSLVPDAIQLFDAQLGVNPTSIDAMQSEFVYNLCDESDQS